jgi:hypothetical protein
LIKTDLEKGSVDGWTDQNISYTGVHDATISGLGLSPSKYVGKIDKNGDYLFDVAQDLERLRGENARDWYFLGFDSERRNALWDPDIAYVSFDAGAGNANINMSSLFPGRDVLVHRHLPIAANTRYRVSFMAKTYSSNGGFIRIALRNNGTEEATQVVTPTAGVGWQMFTFALDSKGAGAELAFVVSGLINLSMTSLSMIQDDAVMDFDTADKRFSWRNDNTGGRALILPDGETSDRTTSPTFANWAGYAVPTPGRAAGSDWPLRNRQLAFVPGTRYHVCLDARQNSD